MVNVYRGLVGDQVFSLLFELINNELNDIVQINTDFKAQHSECGAQTHTGVHPNWTHFNVVFERRI